MPGLVQDMKIEIAGKERETLIEPQYKKIGNSFQNGQAKALQAIQNKASAVGVKLENAEYFTISEIKDGKHKHQWGEKFDSVEEAKKEIEIYSRAKSNDAQGTTFSIQSSGGTVADVVKK